ncbi:NLPA lipoprotein [Desulfofarcimen acetoxidans DSM 771]|uniref:NLPA lipoprotein n=1 Tax=Desulfofarcimen acetoxidans (strain ATCC 49208 / DSM 771 / KCTC 5769 / VKM B-1644 / 5575) TaxID=485916 RepID=C8VZW9_DESAS|nr:NLPA lipoprotein [Desulfofarcimen acetoxidans DSM 771]
MKVPGNIAHVDKYLSFGGVVLLKCFRLLSMAVLFSLLLVGCSQQQKVDKEEHVKIKLGILPIVDSLPLIVAGEKGYFKQAGVDVELVSFPSAVERDSALQAKAIDGSLGDLLAAASLYNGGFPVQVVSLSLGETGKEGRFAILSAPKSGISNVNQLKGVEVSVSKNSIIEYVTDSLLLEKGFQPEEIKKSIIPKIPVRYQALMEGQIKAACLPDPMAALAQSKGAKLIIDDTETNLSQTVIFFNRETLQNNGAAVKKFLAGYALAAQEINNNPESYRAMLVDKAKVPKEALGVYAMEHFPAPQLPEKKDVEQVLQWMLQKKLLKEKITYQNLVTGDYLPEK